MNNWRSFSEIDSPAKKSRPRLFHQWLISYVTTFYPPISVFYMGALGKKGGGGKLRYKILPANLCLVHARAWRKGGGDYVGRFYPPIAAFPPFASARKRGEKSARAFFEQLLRKITATTCEEK